MNLFLCAIRDALAALALLGLANAAQAALTIEGSACAPKRAAERSFAARGHFIVHIGLAPPRLLFISMSGTRIGLFEALDRGRRVACLGAPLKALVIALALGLALMPAGAAAHAWYPKHCCSGRDCFRLADVEVEMRPAGWFIPATGEVIDYQDARVGYSPDGKFHRCLFDSGKTRCLFVPGAGS